MRLDIGPMTDDEFAVAIEDAVGGMTKTCTGASQPMSDLITRIAFSAPGRERDALVLEAERLHADESPSGRERRPVA